MIRPTYTETAFELVPGAPLVPPVPGFQQAAQLVSDYCTKLAVLFSSPSPSPSPADCAALCGRLGQTASHLVATYHHISPSYGTLYITHTHTHTHTHTTHTHTHTHCRCGSPSRRQEMCSGHLERSGESSELHHHHRIQHVRLMISLSLSQYTDTHTHTVLSMV